MYFKSIVFNDGTHKLEYAIWVGIPLVICGRLCISGKTIALNDMSFWFFSIILIELDE